MPPEPRVVLITGASSGIGEAAAREFSRQGDHVVLAARRLDRLERLAEELRAQYPGCRPMTVRMDVTKEKEIHAGVRSALDRHKRIDELFANAGVAGLDWLEELEPGRDIRQQLRTNLEGLIFTVYEVVPHMVPRRSGHIILMSSMAGWVAMPTYSVYAASKFGVRGFGDALRREVSAWGIHVSTVFVGAVRTGFAAEAVRRRRTGLTTPSALVVSPERLARRIVHLTRRPRATVVMPGILRPVILLETLFPGLIDRLSESMFVRRERADKLSGDPPTDEDQG
jgi:short-subunit dehydrogenase